MKKTRVFTWILFAAYLVVLVWVIVFKFGLVTIDPDRARLPINFVPFGASVLTNGRADVSEIIANVIAFVPLGLFLSMLELPKKPWTRILAGLAVSLVFEAAEYALAIGSADITDVITNTLGTLIGVGACWAFKKLFKKKAELIADIVFAVLLVLFLAAYTVLFLAN